MMIKKYILLIVVFISLLFINNNFNKFSNFNTLNVSSVDRQYAKIKLKKNINNITKLINSIIEKSNANNFNILNTRMTILHSLENSLSKDIYEYKIYLIPYLKSIYFNNKSFIINLKTLKIILLNFDLSEAKNYETINYKIYHSNLIRVLQDINNNLSNIQNLLDNVSNYKLYRQLFQYMIIPKPEYITKLVKKNHLEIHFRTKILYKVNKFIEDSIYTINITTLFLVRLIQ